MRSISKILTLICAVAFFASCDDNTGSLGLYPETDFVTNSTSIYEITTRSLALDSVVANSAKSYLGHITDPETGTDITASFATQFHTFEDYSFPDQSLMMGTAADGTDQKGIIQCDSVEVRLYFDDYYGDDNNTMKVEVYALDSSNLLEEDSTYYTSTDLTKFLPADAKPLTSRVISPMDYNLSETDLTSSSHSHNVRLVLPTSYGQNIMQKYYDNPSNFKDSYHFIRNVMPGLYFRTTSGKGTMLNVYVGTCNVYFHYGDAEEADSVYTGLARFSATPEVIQSTHFANGNMTSLIEDSTCTYLKTPAGICTEMTLPIDEVFSGEHKNDSVSMASVTLTRYNKSQDSYQLGTPATLLMVRKADYYDFFREHRVSNSRTSYTTSFSSTYNTYTFDNIARLISYCKHQRQDEAAAEGITEEEWTAKNPDWDKVLLVPVVTSSNTSGTQVSVTHDMDLNSIRLVGGTTPIKMQVIYSQFSSSN